MTNRDKLIRAIATKLMVSEFSHAVRIRWAKEILATIEATTAATASLLG
jgi:hypothetical protein